MLETSPSNGYKQTTSFFTSCRFLLPITLAVIFILGLGIRLYDLTDPPLDFHATRQLRSLLMARGLYHKWFEDPNIPDWQRQIAIEQWEGHQIIEPPIFEIIAALTYGLVGFETDWIARIWASLFWLIGGAALFLVARRLSSADGGVVALAFYIFLPFGVIASRSFQPDPLMVMWIVVSWWTFYRWYQSPSWQRAIFAGLSAGMALLTKNVSVFFLLFPFAALLLMGKGFKKTLRDPQSWVIAGLAALPLVIFTLYGLWVLELGEQFGGRFFPELLKDPSHYIKWFNEVLKIMAFPWLLGGLLGMFAFKKADQRAFV
ncbi:MAG: ArnT family glycosyltransferase, partial [Anaerolineales bacterium]